MSFDSANAAHRSIVLADGRRLAYAEYGDPSGRPVLNNHGGLLCRLDVALAHDDARALGIRIISPDRPGVGASSPDPGRTLVDWGNDVEQLLDAIGVGEITTMGWSLGGQYALGVAHHLGERVRATAVIAGCPPLDEQTFAELNRTDQRLLRLSRKQPRAARASFAITRVLFRRFPNRTTRASVKDLPATDRAIILANTEWFAANWVEATRHPQGMVEEYQAWGRPWGFDPAEIATPVSIWQGTEDTMVPPSWAGRLGDTMPECHVHLVEGEGHLIAVSRCADILSDLVGR